MKFVVLSLRTFKTRELLSSIDEKIKLLHKQKMSDVSSFSICWSVAAAWFGVKSCFLLIFLPLFSIECWQKIFSKLSRWYHSFNRVYMWHVPTLSRWNFDLLPLIAKLFQLFWLRINRFLISPRALQKLIRKSYKWQENPEIGNSLLREIHQWTMKSMVILMVVAVATQVMSRIS